MTALDFFLLAVVAISVVAAAIKGFFYEVWMMVAAVVAVAVAAWQFPLLAPHLGWALGWLSPQQSAEAANFVAFLLLLLLVLIAAMIVGRLLRSVLHAVGLRWPDRMLGAALGLARGLLLAIAVVTMMVALPFQAHAVAASRLGPDLLWGGRALAPMLPPALESRFQAEMLALGKELQ
ncbi:MAG: CvpA family protein [Terriglobales bacterium]